MLVRRPKVSAHRGARSGMGGRKGFGLTRENAPVLLAVVAVVAGTVILLVAKR